MKKMIIFLALVFALSSCSTSGNIRNGVKLDENNMSIYVSSYFSGYEERHIDQVLRTLEKHGFTVSANKSDSKYYLDFMISAGAVVTVEISILEKGKEIISAKSSNAGWGTVIARPVAISSRVEAAISELDDLLEDAI